MLTTAEAYKVAGVWDQLAGYETEEICMAVTQEQYKKLTRFLRDNFPDKRIFSCLSMYEVRGDAPAGFTIAPMSYDTYGYITDIGYDWYNPRFQLGSFELAQYLDRFYENIDR